MLLNGLLTPKEGYYATFNKQLKVYATRGEKSIQVKRLHKGLTNNNNNNDNDNDNNKSQNLVSSIFIRDLNQVVTCNWDLINGKYLTIFFKDGSIRINDMLQNGKLVAFLRTKLNDIDFGYWDRIIIRKDRYDENESMSFNYDILDLLPKLVKYNSKDEPPNMFLYVPQVPIWRTYKQKIIDIHLLHQSVTDSFVLVIDGEYIINLSDSNPNKKLCKILKETDGLYSCYYENGFIKEIDVRSILNNNSKGKFLTLIQTYSLIDDYFEFWKYHINTILQDLVLPFLTFTHKLKDEEIHGFNIYEHLVTLFFDGIVSNKLADWLKYSLSEKNLEMLQVMIDQAYKTTTQILMMCIIPVIERLLILTNQLQSILLSIQLINQGKMAELEQISIIEAKQIIKKCQELLKKTIEKIKIITHENSLLKILLIWLDDKRNSVIDEDHIDNLDINSDSSYGFQIMDGLDIIFGRDTKYDILDSSIFLETIKLCKDQLQKVNKLYVIELLTSGLVIGDFIPFMNHIYGSKFIALLDIEMTTFGDNQIIIYIVKILDNTEYQIKLGLMDYNDHSVKKDVKIPYANIEDVTGIHIAKDTIIKKEYSENDEDVAGDSIIFNDKICIITQYHDTEYRKHVCHILKEPLSPFRTDANLNKHHDLLKSFIPCMELSFCGDTL
ncbi:hypothetical protein RI543_001377 [Arxiozyma heterogenica]|uniref:Anaphase-promoting complex subunit 4 n=1 Tax=Arxiozyma heterogenica TaxID=278026 RepID=A0AAN8A9B9_9SACH|nr:hypothetical protein RI543_001377 [Kazachstania heterogenica]